MESDESKICPNRSAPWFADITITSQYGSQPWSSSTGKAFVPQTWEQYDDPATTSVDEGYDADGNQLRDGRWDYTWDGENIKGSLRTFDTSSGRAGCRERKGSL